MANVFLSYSRKDQELAKRIADDLNAQGIGVWVDAHEIDVGDSVPERLGDGLVSQGYFAIILSKHSINSAWVRKELNVALMTSLDTKSITILPILFDDCVVPPLLRDVQYADFRNSYADGLSALLQRLSDNQRRAHSLPDGAVARSQEDTDLQLVDFHAAQDTESECAFPIFDFTLLNNGDHTTVLTSVAVHVLEAIPHFVPIGRASTVFVSEQYNLMLNPLEKPGIRDVSVSHVLVPSEVDRFQLRIGADPNVASDKGGRYRDGMRGLEVMRAAQFKVKFVLHHHAGNTIETQPFTFVIPFPGDWHHYQPPFLIGPRLTDKVKALAHEEARVRTDAARNLALIGDPSVLPKLLQGLSDPDLAVRREIAIAAGRLGAVQALDFLSDSLNDAVIAEHGGAISQIAKAIACIEDTAADDVLIGGLERMLKARKDTDFGAYWWPMDAFIAGLGYRKHVASLTHLLTADESAIRSRAAEQLGRIGGSRCVNALMNQLRTERDGHVVFEICRGLRISADSTATDGLRSALQRVSSGEIEKPKWSNVSLNEYIVDCIATVKYR